MWAGLSIRLTVADHGLAALLLDDRRAGGDALVAPHLRPVAGQDLDLAVEHLHPIEVGVGAAVDRSGNRRRDERDAEGLWQLARGEPLLQPRTREGDLLERQRHRGGAQCAQLQHLTPAHPHVTHLSQAAPAPPARCSPASTCPSDSERRRDTWSLCANLLSGPGSPHSGAVPRDSAERVHLARPSSRDGERIGAALAHLEPVHHGVARRPRRAPGRAASVTRPGDAHPDRAAGHEGPPGLLVRDKLAPVGALHALDPLLELPFEPLGLALERAHP